MIEEFQIPGVGAIIERETSAGKEILIQERFKPNSPTETGLLEIPAGKIRKFENLFDTLRREVLEETGLTIEHIDAEQHSDLLNMHDYSVLSCEPFCVSQNISGSYPILVITFLCRANGKLLSATNESKNIRWIAISQLAKLLESEAESFYAMHIYALKKYLNINLSARVSKNG
ncbi:MAG: NUDIX domain-containing protein [Oceanospirillaceae bacterium]